MSTSVCLSSCGGVEVLTHGSEIGAEVATGRKLPFVVGHCGGEAKLFTNTMYKVVLYVFLSGFV